MICDKCKSSHVQKKGIRNGSQRFRCMECTFQWAISLEGPIMTGYDHVKPGDVMRFDFPNTVRIHGLTDIHHGANEHHWEMFDKIIDEIKNDPDARWFGNGDLVECIPPKYKISQRGQAMEPDEQIETFCERIEPIKDKCLFIRGGNHDTIRSVNALGLDVVRLIAGRVGVPYFELPGFTVVTVGDTEWKLVSGHGKSGAQNGDLELKKMQAVYSDGDVFYLGHNHQLYAKPVDSLRVDGDEERLKRVWFVRGGSCLKYADYARYSFYPPVRTGWVTMEFSERAINCWTN